MSYRCDSCNCKCFVLETDGRIICDTCGGNGVLFVDQKPPLTDEQKAQNLDWLTEYTKPARIPDGAPWPDVLRALQTIASLREGEARLIGNLRADDIARACGEALAALEAPR